MIVIMNRCFTRVLIVVGLALLNACMTEKVVQAPLLAILPSFGNGEIIIAETRNITTGEITTATSTRSASFSFQAVRGTISGRILEYRITSKKIGAGVNLINPNNPISEGLHLYVQSGFSCTPQPPITRNCSAEAGTQADGISSNVLLLDPISTPLASYMSVNRSSEVETWEITFFGLDMNGKPFEIPVKGVKIFGQFNGVN